MLLHIKIAVQVTAMICINTLCYSQEASLERIKYELYQINKVFDSARYLSFDADIRYSSDTVYGKFESDHQFVTYILNGNQIYYKAGGLQFIQNDSLTITISDDDESIFVTRQSLQRKSELFPLREFVDSLVDYFQAKYTLNLSGSDSLEKIEFIGNEEGLPFQKFTATYFPRNKFLKSLTVSFLQEPHFEELSDSRPPSTSPPENQKPIGKTITMDFSNYRFIDNPDIFDDSQYIWFDRFRKAYIGAGKYKDYRLNASNLETSPAEYNDIEIPAPAVIEDK